MKSLTEAEAQSLKLDLTAARLSQQARLLIGMAALLSEYLTLTATLQQANKNLLSRHAPSPEPDAKSV